MARTRRRFPSDGNAKRRQTYELTRPVFFVGFMGAGKTTICRMIARRYRLSAIDVDSYIVRQENLSVTEIFERVGEQGFRKIETEVLRKLACGENALISCGGGIVVTPENREILKSDSCVVFLKTTAVQAKERISDLSTRPLFNNLEEAERRNAERLPLYEEVASITVSVVGRSKQDVCRAVARNLFQSGALVKCAEADVPNGKRAKGAPDVR